MNAAAIRFAKSNQADFDNLLSICKLLKQTFAYINQLYTAQAKIQIQGIQRIKHLLCPFFIFFFQFAPTKEEMNKKDEKRTNVAKHINAHTHTHKIYNKNYEQKGKTERMARQQGCRHTQQQYNSMIIIVVFPNENII